MHSGIKASHVQHTPTIQKNKAAISLVGLIFSLQNLMCYYLVFHVPNFLIKLFKQMIRNSHSQLRKKNSCSVKLQDETFDLNPRKITAVEGSIFL